MLKLPNKEMSDSVHAILKNLRVKMFVFINFVDIGRVSGG